MKKPVALAQSHLCKDLSFSPEQVAQLLSEDLPVAQLRGMLRLGQVELD